MRSLWLPRITQGMIAGHIGKTKQEERRASTCLPCRPIDGLERKASIIVEVFARPWRRIGCYIGANDYRPSHRRDRGVGRGTCESHHALGASRWPRIDRQRTCLCGSGHAADRQHASRQADRGRLAVADQRGATSVFPACITEGRRDARWHHGCRSRKQAAIPSPLPSSTRA